MTSSTSPRLDLWLTVPAGLEQIAKHEVATTLEQVTVSHRGILRASAALAADDAAAAVAFAARLRSLRMVEHAYAFLSVSGGAVFGAERQCGAEDSGIRPRPPAFFPQRLLNWAFVVAWEVRGHADRDIERRSARSI